MEEFKIADVARLTGLSRSTVLKKIKSGEIESFKKKVPWGSGTREEYRVRYEAIKHFISLKGGSSRDMITLLNLIFEEIQSVKKAVDSQNAYLQQLLKDKQELD